MTKRIDLNCDMGESYGTWNLGADDEIMPLITSASIGCGFHGGDPHVMRKTVALAMKHGVGIGSHPGLPDLLGFGRRVMNISPQELKDYMCYQTGALREFVRAAGGDLQHMKLHGILSSMVDNDEKLAAASAEAVRESGGDLIVVTLAGRNADRLSRAAGLRVAAEGFADRAYDRNGNLVSRKLPGSVLTDPARAAEQAVMLAEGKVRTIDGVAIDVAVDTICCHGDTPGAPNIVRAVRTALERAGFHIEPLGKWLPQAKGSRE